MVLADMLIEILLNQYNDKLNDMASKDGLSAPWNLQGLRRWFSILIETGTKSGYHSESTKFWLAVKSCASEKIRSFFLGTKIKIITEGLRYLGRSAGILMRLKLVHQLKLLSTVKDIS